MPGGGVSPFRSWGDARDGDFGGWHLKMFARPGPGFGQSLLLPLGHCIPHAGSKPDEAPQPAALRWMHPNEWAAIQGIQEAAAGLLPDNKLLHSLTQQVS